MYIGSDSKLRLCVKDLKVGRSIVVCEIVGWVVVSVGETLAFLEINVDSVSIGGLPGYYKGTEFVCSSVVDAKGVMLSLRHLNKRYYLVTSWQCHY